MVHSIIPLLLDVYFTETTAMHCNYLITASPPRLDHEGLEARAPGSQAPGHSKNQVICGLWAQTASFFSPAPAWHKPEIFIASKDSNMEFFPHWCWVVPPDSWTTMERILKCFETHNRKRTVTAYSGILPAESKDPVVQVSWNKQRLPSVAV